MMKTELEEAIDHVVDLAKREGISEVHMCSGEDHDPDERRDRWRVFLFKELDRQGKERITKFVSYGKDQ